MIPGEQIGPYRVEALIGAGGMGEVYRAHDAKLNRDVAIKVLPPAFATDANRLARFKREAQVLASLNHPNIGAIHGFEDDDGVHALVLELIDGPTLADRIAQGPLPHDEALAIARQIADALEAAHEQGIIHRDLKPANIKVRDDGTVKVLDFGLAKLAQPDSALEAAGATQSPTLTTPGMTAAGVILGTAAYMSPEQAKGRVADKRSDVWAFGCVLYEMLTARRAFDGEDVSDTLALVLRGEPAWALLPADTTASIVALIHHCLERDPRRRIASISTARFLLNEGSLFVPAGGDSARDAATATQASIDTAVARARSKLLRTTVLPLAAVALAGVAAAALAIWKTAPDVDGPIARFSLGLGDDPVASTGRHSLAISQDGRQFAYVATGGRLFRRQIGEFNAELLASGGDSPGGLGANSPVFSPDGRTLAFYSPQEQEVRRIAVSGGAAVTVCRTDPPFGMTWDVSGILVGQGSKGIVRCARPGAAPEVLATVAEGEEAHGPQLLPDGRTLIFSIAKVAHGMSRWDRAVVVAQPLPSGERKVLITGGSDPRYLPTGQLVYALGGRVLAVPFDLKGLSVTGEPVPVIEGVRRPLASTTGAAQFATSANGTLIYVPGPVDPGSTEMLLAIADRGGVVTNLPLPRNAYSHVRASPDGLRLAIGTDDGREAIVWIYRMGSNAPMQRLTLTGANRFPIWSPDGLRVAFQSDRDGDRAIYIQRVDGVGVAARLTKAAANEAHIPESWSPDGSRLSVAIEGHNGYSLALASATDGTLVPFGGVTSIEPIGSVFSPDGKWIAYATSAQGGGGLSPNRGVFVQPVPATGETWQAPKQGLDFHPVWSRDGKALIWVPSAASNRIAVAAVTTQPTIAFGDVALLPQRVTADRPSGNFRAFDVLPDGRFVGPVVATESGAWLNSSEVRVVLNWFKELTGRVAANP